MIARSTILAAFTALAMLPVSLAASQAAEHHHRPHHHRHIDNQAPDSGYAPPEGAGYDQGYAPGGGYAGVDQFGRPGNDPTRPNGANNTITAPPGTDAFKEQEKNRHDFCEFAPSRC